jgi:hypothetical protein
MGTGLLLSLCARQRLVIALDARCPVGEPIATESEPMAASSETGRIRPTSLCLLMTIARGRHQRGARGIWGELGHAAGPRAAGWICRMPRSSYRLVAGLAPSYRACSGPPCSSLSLKTRDMPTGDRGQATRPWRMTIIAQAWHGPSSS